MPARKRTTSKPKVTRAIGESDVKSLDGLVFGTLGTLPKRRQTIDPARTEAGKAFAARLVAGDTASDGKSYPTQHVAYLGGMTYRRLLLLGLELNKVVAKAHVRVVQNGPTDFVWTVYATVAKTA